MFSNIRRSFTESPLFMFFLEPLVLLFMSRWQLFSRAHEPEPQVSLLWLILIPERFWIIHLCYVEGVPVSRRHVKAVCRAANSTK